VLSYFGAVRLQIREANGFFGLLKMPSLQLHSAFFNVFRDVLYDLGEVKPRTLMLVGGAALLVLTTLYRYFAAWYRLRHVPGPFIQSWTSLIQVKKMWEGHGHLYYHGLAEKYGDHHNSTAAPQ
jgi:hypothetical protein